MQIWKWKTQIDKQYGKAIWQYIKTQELKHTL